MKQFNKTLVVNNDSTSVSIFKFKFQVRNCCKTSILSITRHFKKQSEYLHSANATDGSLQWDCFTIVRVHIYYTIFIIKVDCVYCIKYAW